MLPGRPETCEDGHLIKTIEGVRPRPISEMPKKCKCGRALKYSKVVEFHPSPSSLPASSPLSSVDLDADGDLVLDRLSVWSDDIYKGPVIRVSRGDTAEQVRDAVVVAVVMHL